MKNAHYYIKFITWNCKYICQLDPNALYVCFLSFTNDSIINEKYIGLDNDLYMKQYVK